MAESEEKLKSLLMKVKEECEKTGSRLNIHKMKIMASGPITSCLIDGEVMEIVTDFILLGSKITVGGDWGHDNKRCLVNQSWRFIERPDDEAEASILWTLDANNWLTGKDPDEKDWRQEEKGMTEDETVRWHHRLNGHEFEQALGDGDGQKAVVNGIEKSWTWLGNWNNDDDDDDVCVCVCVWARIWHDFKKGSRALHWVLRSRYQSKYRKTKMGT